RENRLRLSFLYGNSIQVRAYGETCPISDRKICSQGAEWKIDRYHPRPRPGTLRDTVPPRSEPGRLRSTCRPQAGPLGPRTGVLSLGALQARVVLAPGRTSCARREHAGRLTRPRLTETGGTPSVLGHPTRFPPRAPGCA